METRYKIIIVACMIPIIAFLFFNLFFVMHTDPLILNDSNSLSDEEEQKISNKTNIITKTHDMSEEEKCAQYFDMAMDEFVSEHDAYHDSTGAALEQLSEDPIVSTSKQFAKWRSTSCAFSISEWAYLSDYEDWIWKNIGPDFKIQGLSSWVKPNEPIFVTVEKIGYAMCDQWNAQIINKANNSTVWKKDVITSCVTESPITQHRFNYQISNEINPIIIPDIGNYSFQIHIGHAFLQKDFLVRENSSNPTLNYFEPKPTDFYPRYSISIFQNSKTAEQNAVPDFITIGQKAM